MDYYDCNKISIVNDCELYQLVCCMYVNTLETNNIINITKYTDLIQKHEMLQNNCINCNISCNLSVNFINVSHRTLHLKYTKQLYRRMRIDVLGQLHESGNAATASSIVRKSPLPSGATTIS